MRAYDLVVIGGGPGGYEAALEAAGSYGMRTALVEKEALGGTCLNHGCIPTKTLLHSAELYRQMKECALFGLRAENPAYDIERIQDRKEEVLTRLRGGIAAMMKQKKVEVIQGTGRIRDGHTVEVFSADREETGFAAEPGEAPHCTGRESARILDTENILIATGSRAFIPPIKGADLPNVVTSDELLEKRDGLYQRLTIIGGGVIGMEFAGIYSDFGAKVTVVEALERIIANMDRELSQSLKMLLKKRGVEVITGASVKEIRQEEDGSLVCIYAEEGKKPAGSSPGAAEENGKRVVSDGILVCVGRRPCTDGLFGPGFTVDMEKGRILTDEHFQTSVPGVYAIGDVTGGVMLAHAASAMGKNAVAAMNGKDPEFCMTAVPGCIYTEPEIASVGLTTEMAKEQGIPAESKKIVMTANGRTVLCGGERGFIKVVSEKDTGRILGASMMCERASDLISEFTDAIVHGRTLRELAEVIRPHPTFSEAITEAVKR